MKKGHTGCRRKGLATMSITSKICCQPLQTELFSEVGEIEMIFFQCLDDKKSQLNVI
jgi:hypothetical protein